MRTKEEVRDRLEEVERKTYEHAAGCGERPSESVSEIRTLRWVLGED